MKYLISAQSPEGHYDKENIDHTCDTVRALMLASELLNDFSADECIQRGVKWLLDVRNTLMGPYVDQYLGGSSTLFAVFEISFDLGGVISGLIVSRALRRYGYNIGIITLAGMGVMAAASYRESIILIVVSLFGLGFFTMLHLVTMQTLIQVNTPKKLLALCPGCARS